MRFSTWSTTTRTTGCTTTCACAAASHLHTVCNHFFDSMKISLFWNHNSHFSSPPFLVILRTTPLHWRFHHPLSVIWFIVFKELYYAFIIHGLKILSR